ncbi:MAG: hypothetical protein JWR61_3187 [Ferruginibacter sp.]|uniref:hypothetical protein n=1 Tax=Ferruginibacter sp. TaxID=1940288 RepID=UPI002659BADD|nr:hypothetical protein [Ferruginibacter sp.]MDB5278232.1 hypothetical protein [Ferruginibacter sp.]
MPATAFENKEIRYAYDSIHEFFDSYGLGSAIQRMESVLKASLGDKAWKKADPYSLLYFMQKLEALCGAAFMIHFNCSTRAGAIVKEPQNGDAGMLQKQHLIGGQSPRTEWHYFPRSLTAGQYCNPCKAIKKFVVCMTEPEWKNAISTITEFALRNDSINNEDYPCNVLTLRRRLLQLIEGCYLLDIRTNMQNQPNTKQQTKKIKK